MGLYGKPCVVAAAATHATPVKSPAAGGKSLAATGLPYGLPALAALLLSAAYALRRRAVQG